MKQYIEKQSRIKKFFLILCIAVIAALVFGFVTMGLWNALLPEILGVKSINFVQALGLLVLSKILFGGLGRGGGGFGRRRQEWKQQMQQKLSAMSPEEREKFTAEWKNRCGGKMWRPFQQDTTSAE